MVKLLHARGVEVTVLTGKPNYPGGQVFNGYKAAGVQRDQYGAVPVLRLPIMARGQNSGIRLALNYLSFILAGCLFGPRLVRKAPYDLVFVYAPSPLLQALPAVLLARKAKVPLVLWVQDLWPESLSATGYVSNRQVLFLVERLVRFIYRSSDRILVQSQAFIKAVAALTDRHERIQYYPNLYEPSVSNKAGLAVANFVSTLRAHFCIVFAGNLGTAQALDNIIAAARQLLPYEQIRIVLVGSGSQDDWLAKQCKIHGLNNVILAGRFDAADMPPIFSAAQALLVSLRPDPTFSLTIPSKVQAYLAAGRPIIAALDGEGARIVNEAGAGLCSAAGDVEGLVSNVLKLFRMSASERNEMGQSGKHYFQQHFSPDMLADKLLEHFNEVIMEREKG